MPDEILTVPLTEGNVIARSVGIRYNDSLEVDQVLKRGGLACLMF